MTYRVVTVVFTKRKLSALEIAEQKKYLFILGCYRKPESNE